jgi:hypothetical protein
LQKNHSLTIQGEDEAKRESERIQRMIYRDENLLCYKAKLKIVNGMFMPKKLYRIKKFNGLQKRRLD